MDLVAAPALVKFVFGGALEIEWTNGRSRARVDGFTVCFRHDDVEIISLLLIRFAVRHRVVLID